MSPWSSALNMTKKSSAFASTKLVSSQNNWVCGKNILKKVIKKEIIWDNYIYYDPVKWN
jgi:hypothetical protein